MTAVRLIRSSRLTHAEYADAAVIPADAEVVVLAGVCPLDEDGATVAPGDVAAQTRHALANLDVALAECGVGIRDVANIRISVASTERVDLHAAWGAFRERVGDLEIPATLSGVTVLGYADQLVELEVLAARMLS